MKIALIGYGKMGHIIESIALQRGHEVVATIDINNQEDFDSEAFASADVAIEFTRPETAVGNMQRCFERHIPVVVGTTVWHQALPQIEEECKAQNGKVTDTVKTKREVKDEKYEVRVSNKEERNRRKKAYVYKEVKKVHKAGFPKFFHVFFSIIVGGALVVSSIMFNKQSDVFTIGDYDFREVGVGQ